jgi:hypothetical protein
MKDTIVVKTSLSTEIDLNKRIEYLSRAVVCVKTGESSGSDTGDLMLHGLEEKMEVARVQVRQHFFFFFGPPRAGEWNG